MQIRIVVLIHNTITKWSKRPGKADQKWKFSPHASPISGHSCHRDVGCLLALAGRYKPPKSLPFWGLPSATMRSGETAEQGSSLASCRACHSFTQAHRRVSKVENVYTEKAERLELWVFLPCPEDPGRALMMIAYSEWYQICDLWRWFNFGTWERHSWSLITQELLCSNCIKV